MRRLAAAYNQLNAPFGTFASATLGASTIALANPTKYARIEKSLAALITERNKLAVKIRNALDAAAFRGKALKRAQAELWTGQSFAVLSHALALDLVER